MINNIPKRHFYNNKDYFLDFEKKILILDPEFHEKLLNKKLWNRFGFKKIGGSSVGDVLAVDKYKSQFQAFCRIAWCSLPILDKKYVNAGIKIEPKVVAALKETLKVDIEQFPPEKYNFDYFEDKDEIIGGIPDGYINEKKIIIEIKTTGEKNYEQWKQFGIPAGYLKQAQIYTYLMGVKKFWIVAAFLKEEDYLNPDQFPIKQRKLKNYPYILNEAQVLDDINTIKEWYKKYTKLGYSPAWDEEKDSDLIEYLKCENEQQYLELLEKWKIEGKFIDEP